MYAYVYLKKINYNEFYSSPQNKKPGREHSRDIGLHVRSRAQNGEWVFDAQLYSFPLLHPASVKSKCDYNLK